MARLSLRVKDFELTLSTKYRGIEFEMSGEVVGSNPTGGNFFSEIFFKTSLK